MERNTSDILIAVSLHKIQLLNQLLHCLIMVMPCRLHLHTLTHLCIMYINIERLSPARKPGNRNEHLNVGESVVPLEKHAESNQKSQSENPRESCALRALKKRMVQKSIQKSARVLCFLYIEKKSGQNGKGKREKVIGKMNKQNGKVCETWAASPFG